MSQKYVDFFMVVALYSVKETVAKVLCSFVGKYFSKYLFLMIFRIVLHPIYVILSTMLQKYKILITKLNLNIRQIINTPKM